jgi:glutaredoxin
VASIRNVVLYTAQGCHLCERAREVLDAEGLDYREIDITGDPQLEASHREWLPVVEIDGERAFVYRIPVEALRRKLVAQS